MNGNRAPYKILSIMIFIIFFSHFSLDPPHLTII